MNIYRVRDENQQIRFAVSDDGRVFFGLSGDPFYGERVITNERIDVASILAPVEPRIIFCIGLNYRQHAAETGATAPEHPVVFVKAPSSVQDPNAPIALPRHLRSDQVDYEGELAVVIGYPCKNVSRREALDYVIGYTVANDVSARDWQKDKGGSQWCRGKTFDTFCPLGPTLVTTDAIPNPNNLKIETRLNGKTVQSSNTKDMIFDVATLIEFLSGSTTLESGTVILTGTPSGVGMAAKPPHWLKPGDKVEIEIEAIGVLSNPVAEEKV
jgi:2-keto-4-pentenoate hydratase/2-oxohepta-3-ene-1,7-dioic acid hydratase in catechol pathway